MQSRSGPIIPREHGAWALLYGPFLVTLAVAGPGGVRGLLFFVSLTGLFLAHEPLARLARSRRHRISAPNRNRWLFWLAVYGAVTAISTGLLLWLYELWLLVPMGAAAGAVLGLHLLLTQQKKDRRLAVQLLGVLGLTASAPATCYVLRGELGIEALGLWALNILYFSSGVFHVKMVVSRHTSKATAASRAAHSLLYHLLLLVLIVVLAGRGSLPMLVALAFAPVLARAFYGLASAPGRLNLKRLGYTEVAYTVAFVALAVAGLVTAGV